MERSASTPLRCGTENHVPREAQGDWLDRRRTGAAKLEPVRPALAAMEDGDEVQSLPTCAVRNDEPSIPDNKLASPKQPARPPHRRLGCQKIDRAKNPLGYQGGILLRIPLDVPPKRYQVTDRPRGPDHLHRGAFVSPGLPQDRSHLETCS